MNVFVLWDIDGTLMRSKTASGTVMREAMKAIYGVDTPQTAISYAGKTDQQIVLESYPGLPRDQVLASMERFIDTYHTMFQQNQQHFVGDVQVLDGAQQALERLHANGALQSVLTGNMHNIARLKLDLTGLSQWIDLDIGAYGSDHHDRNTLVPVARRRAMERYGHNAAAARIVVIGDTPFDIACGKAGNARTIAVATGQFDADALATHRPDVILPSLADTDALLAAIYAEPAA